MSLLSPFPALPKGWLRALSALTLVCAVCAGAVALPAQAASSTIVISQFQVAGATATDEFVELHNISASPYELNGQRIVYRAATGTTDTAVVNWTSSTIIPAGGFYLITTASGYDDSVAADATYTGGMNGVFAAAGGGLAIRNGALNTGVIIDSVGYGSASNTFVEGTATSAPAANASKLRTTNGCADTDNNSADFSTATPSTPHNATAPISACGATANQPLSATANPTAINTAQGTAAAAALSASDPDSIVNGASITSGATTGITLDGFAPATATGGSATATLNVSASVPAGSYAVVVTFTNNASQSANLTVNVTVNGPAGVCPSPPAGAPLITIPALQGTSDTNTANGMTRTLRGVVVADVQGATGQNGFYMQDPTGDGDPLTSDGVFIFVPAANSAWFGFDVAVGDAVQVSGTTTEFQGLTEITTVTNITKCGTNTTLAPTVVHLPETTNGELERYEGMLITIPETLTVDQNYFQGRYGQVTLSAGGRLYNPTNIYDAGSAQATALGRFERAQPDRAGRREKRAESQPNSLHRRG